MIPFYYYLFIHLWYLLYYDMACYRLILIFITMINWPTCSLFFLKTYYLKLIDWWIKKVINNNSIKITGNENKKRGGKDRTSMEERDVIRHVDQQTIHLRRMTIARRWKWRICRYGVLFKAKQDNVGGG